MDEFVRWGSDLLHGETGRTRRQAGEAITAFLRDLAALRRRQPADDFMTFVVQAEVEGRKLNDEEVLGIGALIFVAGLDTVAAALGFDFNHLARDPAEQAALRADPSLIPDAVEELLRAYPSVHMIRVATSDVDFEGVRIKAGDRISCAPMLANRDPEAFPDPDRVDFARESNRHMAFAYGPHRCIGSHLARRELIVAIEEWLRRVPPFQIKAGAAPILHGGMVFGVENLNLEWT